MKLKKVGDSLYTTKIGSVEYRIELGEYGGGRMTDSASTAKIWFYTLAAARRSLEGKAAALIARGRG